MTTTPPRTTPPSPTGAGDEAAFVAELRRLRTWSGTSFRQLERRATAAGDVLPASTAATMLGRNRLPREELLVAFLRACGVDGDDALPWLVTRAAIADGTTSDATPAGAVTSARRFPVRLRRWVGTAAALAIAFSCGVAFTAGTTSGSVDEQETVATAP